MDVQSNLDQPFLVKNCSLSAIATGERASSLMELRDKLMVVEEDCLYYHFWGGRMNPQFVHPQQHNDFAYWVYHCLHDHVLAERLSVIDPNDFNNLEDLRQDVVETIERRVDESETIVWTRKEDRFHFIRSAIIVFDRTSTIKEPKDLPRIIASLPSGSIFYHFIDARMRTPEKIDDFSIWLKIFGSKYDSLIEKIQSIDPYFLSLTQLREELAKTIQNHFESEELHPGKPS